MAGSVFVVWQILRDLILSFKLPRSVVGLRRTCLLTREANKIATECHPDTLGGAHDAAMRGARWTWDKDEDPTHKMCALLAGLAVQMCDGPQSVRKDDMCDGRVQLPFLETHAPNSPGALRLALLEHTHEWVVYSTNSRGATTVRLRHAGGEGLCRAVLLFATTL